MSEILLNSGIYHRKMSEIVLWGTTHQPTPLLQEESQLDDQSDFFYCSGSGSMGLSPTLAHTPRGPPIIPPPTPYRCQSIHHLQYCLYLNIKFTILKKLRVQYTQNYEKCLQYSKPQSLVHSISDIFLLGHFPMVNSAIQ